VALHPKDADRSDADPTIADATGRTPLGMLEGRGLTKAQISALFRMPLAGSVMEDFGMDDEASEAEGDDLDAETVRKSEKTSKFPPGRNLLK